jgi:hypothetical protein
MFIALCMVQKNGGRILLRRGHDQVTIQRIMRQTDVTNLLFTIAPVASGTNTAV